MYPVNPNRYYTTQVELGQSILSARMDAEYYGALSRGESPNYDNASINKQKQVENTERILIIGIDGNRILDICGGCCQRYCL